MSYNISTWKTKRLEDLIIPLSALYDLDEGLKRRGWLPDAPRLTFVEDSIRIEIRCAEGGHIAGELLLDCKSIAADEVCLYGEGSGTFCWEVLKPALQQSKGILEAVLIWEGGSSISRLICNDGEVTEEDIEL